MHDHDQKKVYEHVRLARWQLVTSAGSSVGLSRAVYLCESVSRQPHLWKDFPSGRESHSLTNYYRTSLTVCLTYVGLQSERVSELSFSIPTPTPKSVQQFGGRIAVADCQACRSKAPITGNTMSEVQQGRQSPPPEAQAGKQGADPVANPNQGAAPSAQYAQEESEKQKTQSLESNPGHVMDQAAKDKTSKTTSPS